MTLWRKGLFRNAYAVLADKKRVTVLEDVVHTSRTAPDGLFSLLWTTFLGELEAAGEQEVASLMRSHYLQRDQMQLFTAPWRISIHRILPGRRVPCTLG